MTMDLSRRQILISIGATAAAAAVGVPALAAEPTVINTTTVISNPVYTSAETEILRKIQDALEQTLKHHLFEPNDQVTRLSITQMMEGYLEPLRQRRSILNFHVSSLEVDNEGMPAVSVFVQPSRSITYFSVHGRVCTKDASKAKVQAFRSVPFEDA